MKTDSDPLATIIETAGDTGELVTFIDIDEDGCLDVIVQKMNPSLGGSTLTVLYNNVVTDSFFMKALMLNSE